MGEIVSTSIEIVIVLFIIQEIFDMLVLYCLVILLEVFERNTGFSPKQTIMTILIFTSIGAMISNPTINIDESSLFRVNFSEIDLILPIQLVFYFIAGIWLISILYKNYKSAWSKKQKKIIIWLSLGVFFSIFTYLIAYFVVQILSILAATRSILFILILFLLLRNLGILFIGIAFLRARKEPWLLQRHIIHVLTVYSNNGLQLYSKVFNKNLPEEMAPLIAGGFHAITSLFQEVTKASGKIKSIILEDKDLRIINRDTFLCAIIVDYSTQASEIAHENFTNEFELMFRNELKNFKGEVSIFDRAEKIVNKYFS